MRPFFWRIVICLTPLLIAGGVTFWGIQNDRLKLGVDLSGGTILVYEIDARKVKAQKGDDERSEEMSARAQAELLAEKLKRRIDPNDLYNIIIRPAGEGRVEIILPTGGKARADRAEKDWEQLVRSLEEKYKVKKKIDVNRGRILELAERVQTQVQEEIWGEKLFPKGPALDALAARAAEELKPLREERQKQEQNLAKQAALAVSLAPAGPLNMAAPLLAAPGIPAALQPLKADSLRGLIDEIKARVGDYAKEKQIEGWFKQQAWNVLIERLLTQYPELKQREEQFLKTATSDEERKRAPFASILPDAIDELIGRAEAKGNSFAQAFVSAFEPLLGKGILKGQQGFLSREEVRKFVEANYGPSLGSIEKEIEASVKALGVSRDLTVEQVQDIKEKIARVGSLEFRILANKHDDSEAIELAKAQLNNPTPAMKERLKLAAEKGDPPPPPLREGTDQPKEFVLNRLPRGYTSRVTYSWVELAPQERHALGLDNAAQNEPGRGYSWVELAAGGTRNTAMQLTSPGATSAERLKLGGALFFSRHVVDQNLSEEERRNKKVEYFVLTRNPEIDPDTGKPVPAVTGDYLIAAGRDMGDGRPAVAFRFNARGGQLFGDLTRKNVPGGPGGSGGDASSQIKRHLAIILDGMVVSAPTVNSEITDRGQISGNFTAKEIDQLVNVLRSGALPATLKQQPVSESTMAPTLGQDTIDAGLKAVAFAFLAVIAFMILYYRFAGLVASFALFANVLLTVGFMIAIQGTFTLPGLAALVLMLGMAVDANILIYERIREERERGANLTLAIRNGYDRAFSPIIDTHLSSIFTAVVLYAVGNDQLKGFGVTLTLGLIIGLFTTLYMTRVIFDLWNAMGWLKKLGMFKLFSRPDIDFMSIRYYWFTASIILSLLGVLLFIGRGTSGLNIDFVGGTAYAGQLRTGVDIEELRGLLSDSRQKEMLKDGVAGVREVDRSKNAYSIEYKLPDGSRQLQSVILANEPAGDTKQAREADVARRASSIPDMAVEQIFSTLHQEKDPNKSRFFNIRTSEKEPDLVQAMLDQILQKPNDKKQWESLLARVDLKFDLAAGGRYAELRFYEEGTNNPVFASPSFVKTLLTREMLREFGVNNTKDLKFQMELTGEGKTREGRFERMKLTLTPRGITDAENRVRLTPEVESQIRRALSAAANAFTTRPQPERLETFDSQLAADTRLRAMYAILLSWVAMLAYLWFRFGSWTFGLAAVFCLVHDLCFTIGIIAACHYLHGTALGNFLLIEDFKIDLTAVAALLTLVGYSVNDTIVVFDRIREVRGKNPDLTPQMINDSVNQTLSRTLLASLTTWMVVVVLYVWGGPGVHLFAFVMVVGVIIGTYSSIYIAAPLLLMFGEGARSTQRARERAAQSAGPETGIQPAR